MGPPNKPGTPNGKDNTPHPRSQPIVEKTSLELLLESTERGVPFADVQQFELLRDSLVFNHERIVHQNSNPSTDTPTRLSSRGTQHHPSLNTIHSQSNNYIAPTTPIPVHQNEEFDQDSFEKIHDRSAQNRENANLDKHVGWHQTPVTPRGKNNPFARSQLPFNVSGDIPLTNTAASLHLPSPPTSNMFQDGGEMEPPSATTVTTVYAYKCNRINRQACGRDVDSVNDSYENPLYEERTQEVPYPYAEGGELLPAIEPQEENRESEEQMEVDEQEDINLQSHDVEAKLNTINMVSSQPLVIGDYATGRSIMILDSSLQKLAFLDLNKIN